MNSAYSHVLDGLKVEVECICRCGVNLGFGLSEGSIGFSIVLRERCRIGLLVQCLILLYSRDQHHFKGTIEGRVT